VKIIEPLSSALLITGCVYSAGVAQNSSLMRVFGVNPAFSQPAIDKILYDGGLVTFELFATHVLAALVIVIAALIISAAAALTYSKTKKLPATLILHQGFKNIIPALKFLEKAGGTLLLIYLTTLTILSYNKAREDGKKIAESFVSTCHAVIIEKDKSKTNGCAFNKDRDSIWYYTIKDGESKTGSKPLSELDQIIYLDPIKQ